MSCVVSFIKYTTYKWKLSIVIIFLVDQLNKNPNIYTTNWKKTFYFINPKILSFDIDMLILCLKLGE